MKVIAEIDGWIKEFDLNAEVLIDQEGFYFDISPPISFLLRPDDLIGKSTVGQKVFLHRTHYDRFKYLP